MENVLQNTQHDVDTLQLSYFGTLFFSYFPDRVQSSKVLIIVGTIKTIKHKLSIAFQTDMHNNNNNNDNACGLLVPEDIIRLVVSASHWRGLLDKFITEIYSP